MLLPLFFAITVSIFSPEPASAVYPGFPGYSFGYPSVPLPYQYQPSYYSVPPLYYNRVQPPAPQATAIYGPDKHTFSGYSFQSAFSDGGLSQVYFVTGPQAKQILEDSIKFFYSNPITAPGFPHFALSSLSLDESAKLSSNTIEIDGNKKESDKNKDKSSTTEGPLIKGIPSQFDAQLFNQQHQHGSGAFFYNVEVVPPKIGNQLTYPIPLFAQKFFGHSLDPSLFKAANGTTKPEESTTTEASSSTVADPSSVDSSSDDSQSSDSGSTTTPSTSSDDSSDSVSSDSSSSSDDTSSDSSSDSSDSKSDDSSSDSGSSSDDSSSTEASAAESTDSPSNSESETESSTESGE